MTDIPSMIAWRKLQDRAFSALGIMCTAIGVLALAALLIKLIWDGGPYLSYQFLSSRPSEIFPNKSGISTAIAGTLAVIVVTFFTAVPLGVATAVYLEEYARKNWFTDLIEINISNLAGVPSITYGLLGYWFFCYLLGFKPVVFVGGLTLAVLVLPIIIVTTREALRTIPGGIKEAAYASGATKWQVIRYHLVPYSLGGILTGTIIAMSRALGETAPLLAIGVGTMLELPPSPVQSSPPFLSFQWLNYPFTVLPMLMFLQTDSPDAILQKKAATIGLVLIALTLSLNTAAIVIRYRIRKRIKW
jgi:phosphate ABC transporter, permease protein PstA